MISKNNIYADKGHEFQAAIDAFFESDNGAQRGRGLIDVLGSGEEFTTRDVGALISVLDCISNRDEVITLSSRGNKNFDGYFVLDFQEALVEFSPMGAWQVALLLISTNLMPLFWHSNYARKELVLSQEDLQRLLNSGGITIRNHQFIPSDVECTPVMRPLEDGRSYEVDYHFWAEFGGYFEQHVVVTSPMGFGASCQIKELTIRQEEKRIVPYRAPVMF